MHNLSSLNVMVFELLKQILHMSIQFLQYIVGSSKPSSKIAVDLSTRSL